ncbi:MAG: molybdopterin guanine dinucleotide-containing S/N-oxide reductase [Pseudomonadota bacterium]
MTLRHRAAVRAPQRQSPTDPFSLSRRSFLAGTALATLAAGVGLRPGFAGAATTPPPSVGAVLTSSHWGAFHAEIQDGRLVDVTPFAADPYPTPMIGNFPSLVYDPTRVARPMVRQSYLAAGGPSDPSLRGVEPFVPVDWDTALDLVAAEIERVRTDHGNEAILAGSYGWGSAGQLHNPTTLTNRAFALLGGYVDDITNYSYGAGMTLLPHIVGSSEAIAGPATTWPVIIEHTDLIVSFGGAAFKNGQITFGGAGAHTTERYMREAAAAGVEMVVINPIRERETAELDADWIAIKPATDTALMLALCHTLLAEDLADREFLERYTTGHDRLIAYITGESDGIEKTPDWAAEITELDAESIRALARRMAASRTMIMTSWSLQRHRFGEQPWWMTVALAAMLGQIGLPGGGFSFAYTSTNGVGSPRAPIRVAALRRGRNPVRLRYPVARIADLLLDPGGTVDYNGRTFPYPDVRMIYWAGGNPFHHHQDLNRLIEAWRKPETIIVHEPFWTATARRADIVLPATTALERNDIGASSRDAHIFAMKQAIAPVGAARSDFDILADLLDRFGLREDYTEGRDEAAWLRHLWDETRAGAEEQGIALPDFDTFWQQGVIAPEDPNPDYVYLGDFRNDPETNALRTPSGLIELFSETIDGFGYDDCPGHPVWRAPEEWDLAADGYPLQLLSTHPRHRLHSQMDNGALARASKVQDREPVYLHPDDAAARDVADGDVVRVFNARGACLAGVVVTADIRPGVICIEEGAWFDPVDPASVGSVDKHGNPNMMTPDIGTSRLGQGCSAQTAMVELVRYDETLPPVAVFDPPAIRDANATDMEIDNDDA